MFWKNSAWHVELYSRAVLEMLYYFNNRKHDSSAHFREVCRASMLQTGEQRIRRDAGAQTTFQI